MVTEKAFAKINLFLDVTSRREDGFHDIVSVMQSVSLCDTLCVSAKYADRTQINLKLDDSQLPTNESNLIYKSAVKYLSHFNINAEVNITVGKLIPIGAGLGGGSSDAAATLRAMNKIFGLASDDQLMSLAAELGSDVPFCITCGRALCTGRGEMVQRLATLPKSYYVIAIGEARVSTPKAYAELDRMYNNFEINREVHRSEPYPIYNIFEQVINLDDICKIKKNMIKSGAEYALMSGSGPAVFGKYKDEEAAKYAEKSLLDEGFSAYCCHTV